MLRGPLSPARAAVVREAISLSLCEIRWMVPEKFRGGYEVLPSGYVKIAIENRHFEWANYELPIFHRYVKLPEGIWFRVSFRIQM